MRWRALCLATGAAVFAATSRAEDQAAGIARLHVEAIGGRERIRALRSFRATGRVAVIDEQFRFTMTAARPNRVRMEMHYADRTLVQGTDGVDPPWEFDPGKQPPKITRMEAAAASVFLAEAEFDDPLAASGETGYRLQYAGETLVDGLKLLRVFVTRNLNETFFLLLDPNTYFILFRLEQQFDGNQTTLIATRYDDFRPVAGVLVAHKITIRTNGKFAQQAIIERIEANPAVSSDVFVRP